MRRSVLILMGLLLLTVLLTVNRPQVVLAAVESDTETFLTTNFDLQSTYTRVLCVHQQTACPPNITTTVPCLVDNCGNLPQQYNINSSYTTIQGASDAALPGDLIIIMAGTYDGIAVEEKHGANNAYIHFLGWGTPGDVVVDAPPSAGIRHNFYFIDTNYYIIQNIAFENSTQGAGVFFSGYFSGTGHFSHHLIMMNIYSHDNYKWGLHTTQASYMVIQDSVFTGSEDEHGAYISGGGDHFLIRRNVFQDNNASGLQVNADPQSATAEIFYYLDNFTGDTCGWTEADVDFIGEATWQDLKACYDSQGLPDLGEYIDDGISKDLIIEQNVTTGNGSAGGGAINLASVRKSVIRNNLVYGNLAGSITCWDNNYAEDKALSSSEFGCKEVKIVNNTVVETAGNRSSMILMNDARQITLFNNVLARARQDNYEISARSGQDLRSGANYYYALSIFDSPGVIQIDTDAGSGSITGFTMPQALANFVSPNDNGWMDLSGKWPQLAANRPDYHPKSNSVLNGMANATYLPQTDFEGNTRSGNVAGAYSVNGGGGTPTNTPTPTATVPTSTPTTAPTSTPTNTPIPGVELLTNVSFELDANSDSIPDDWTGKNLTSDKRKCNNGDKIVAYEGLCAVQLKGGIAENSKFFQKPDPSTLLSGDTLILSAYIRTKNVVTGGTLVVKGVYADTTTKFKEQVNIPAGSLGYVQMVTTPLVLVDGVIKLKVQFGYKGVSGKYYLDLISLVQQGLGASLTRALPLPSVRK